MEDYPVEVYIIRPMTTPRASATGKSQVGAGPWALEAVRRGSHTRTDASRGNSAGHSEDPQRLRAQSALQHRPVGV